MGACRIKCQSWVLNCLVGFYADKESLPCDEVKQNASTILPPILEGLQNEQFQNAISAAVSDLLTKPQSDTISVSIQPEVPIAGPVILGVAIGSPETLPDVLDVNIKTSARSRDSAAASGASSGGPSQSGSATVE